MRSKQTKCQGPTLGLHEDDSSSDLQPHQAHIAKQEITNI
jgi:hypothetical protein